MLLETLLTTQSYALFLTRIQQDQPKSSAAHVQGAEIQSKLLVMIGLNGDTSLGKCLRKYL